MFLVYFVILPLVLSVNIGYLKREGFPDDQYKFELVEKYLKNLTSEIAVVEVVDCSYKARDAEAEADINKCFKEKFSTTTPLIFGFCDNYILNYTGGLLTNYSSYMWCLNTFSIGLCEKRFIMGSSIIPQIHSFMYILSNEVELVGFIGNNKYKGLDEFYAVRLKAAAKYYGLKTYDMLYDDDDLINKIDGYIKNITTDKDLTSAIFTTINDTTIKKVLEKLHTLNPPAKTPILIYLEGGLTIEEMTSLSNNEGNLIFRGYDDSMENNYTKLYKDEYKTSPGITSDYEAIYIMGNIQLIAKAMTQSSIENTDSFLNIVYNNPIEYGGGEIELVSNNYISHTEYVYKIGSGGLLELKYNLPMTTHFEPSQIITDKKEQTCNFLKSEDGIVNVNSITIGFVHSLSSGYLYEEERLLTNFLIFLCDYYNDVSGGIMKIPIQPYIIELNPDNITETIESINDKSEQYQINTIFLSSSSEQRMEISREISNDNIMFFYMGTVEGDDCQGNVIYGKPANLNYILPTVRYIDSLGFDRVLILGSKYKYGYYSRELLIERLIAFGYKTSNLLYRDFISTDDYYLDHFIQNITIDVFNITPSTGGVIVITAEDLFQIPVLKALQRHNLTYENDFHIISFNLNEILIKSVDIKYTANVTFAAHFYDKYPTTSSVIKQFKQSLEYNLNGQYPLTNKVGIFYNLFQLIKQTIELSGSADPSHYREYLYNLQINDPVAGPYDVYYSGYGKGIIRLVQFNDTDSYVVVQDDIFVRTTPVYKDKTYTCSWRTTDSVKGKQKQNYYIVATLFDHTTKAGMQKLDSLILTADIINENGGINGYSLIIEATGYDDKIENLIEKASRYSNNSHLLCFFGTSSSDEQDLISPYLDEWDKLLLVMDKAYGEVAYRNILFINHITHQYLEYPFYWILYKFKKYIVISSEKTMLLKQRIYYLSLLYEFVKKPPLTDPIMYNDTNPSNAFNKIDSVIDANPDDVIAIICILDEDIPSFVHEYNKDSKYDKEKYPLMLFDYNDYYGDEYTGHYAITSYNTLCKIHPKYVEFQTYLDKNKGKSFDIVNQGLVIIYDSINMISNAKASAGEDSSSSTIRNALYDMVYEGLHENVKIDKSNYISSHMFIGKILENDLQIVMEIPFPINAKPYNPLKNDQEYYIADFSLANNLTKTETLFTGIACLFDLTDSSGFLEYMLVQEHIETINFKGGIQGRPVYTELYQCPQTLDDAAPLIIKFFNRGFNLIIGGCNPEKRNIIHEIIQSLNALFVYTGFNEGHVCVQEIISASVTQGQEVYPTLLHLLYHTSKDLAFLYTANKLYNERVTFIKDILTAFGIDVKLFQEVDEVTYDEDLYSYLGIIRKSLPNGCTIIALLEGDQSQSLFKNYYTFFGSLEEYTTSKDIAKDYTIYLFDNTNTHFNGTYAEGNYVYSSIIETSNPLNKQFRQVYNYIADKEDYIELKDLVISASTKWLLQVVTEAKTFSIDDIQKQLYITTLETAMGNLVFTMDNDFLHPSYFGVINENGYIDYILTVSTVWKGESYRMKVNRAKYFECDWMTGLHGNMQKPSYKIGLLLPKNPAYRRDAILYYSAIYTVIDKQNDDEGGIDGKYLMLWVIHDEDDPEKAKKNVIKMVKEQNIFVIFGGFTVEIRRAVMEAADELKFLFFFPTDYEGEECYYNGYYSGLAYTSFYTLIPILMDLSSYDQYLFYTDTNYCSYFSQHLIDDYAYLGRSFKAVYKFPLSKTDVSDVILTIKRLSPQGAILINMLEGDAKYNLIPAMTSHGLLPPLFYSFNINMNYMGASVIGNDVAGHYYWDSFLWDDNNNALLSVQNYFDQLFAHVGLTNIISARGYAMTQIFINIASKCKEINYEEFRRNLYLYPTQTALGEFTFNENNNMDNVLSYKQWYLDSAGKLQTKIIWQTSRVLINRPYGNIFRSEPLYRCSFQFNNTKYLLPSKKIGIIFSTSGDMKKVHAKAILAAVTAFRELYDEGPINEHILLMEFMDYHSDEEYLKTLLDTYDDNKDVVAFVGCSRGQCKSIVQPKLEKTERLFYYPRLSIGEECNRNMFYTSLVANQYVTRLVEYILQTDYKYYFTISEDIYYSVDFNTMIEAQAAGLLEKVGSFLVSDSNPITYQAVLGITEKLKTGIIISTVTKIDMFKTFMIYYSRLGIDTSVIGIVDTLLELEEFDNLDTSLRKDVYKLVRYTYDAVTDTNANFIKKVMNYVDLSMPTGLFESTYASVMLYALAAKKAGSFNIDEVRTASYGLTLEVGSGVLTLTDSHYITSPFFIIKYDSNGQYCNLIYSKLDQESPKAWNWNLDSSYGYICSFSSGREDADKYKVPVKRLALIASLTGTSSKETVGLVDAFQLLISNINDEGGIGGYTIQPDIYDEGSNIDSCRTTIYDCIVDKNPLVIFSYLSNECLEILNPVIETKSILFQLNTIERDKCATHIFVANNYYEFYDTALNVIRNRLYGRIMVIAPENDELVDYTVNFMNSHFMENEYISYSNDNEFNINEVIEILDSDTDFVMTCILFWGDANIFDVLMKTLNDYSFIYTTNVIVMKNMQEILPLKYSNYEYFGYYWKDNPSEINKKFVDGIYQRIDAEVPVSDLMIRARTSGMLLAKSANTIPKTIRFENGDLVADLSIVNVKNALRNFKYETIEGEIYFGSNQYLARIPKFMFVYDENSKDTTVTYEAGDPQVPEVLKNSGLSYRRCDFSNPNILDGETVPTVVIGIILPMTGISRYEGNLLFDTILAAVDEINDSPDKLIGYYVDYQLLDTESDDGLLVEKAKEMLNNENIEFIFGGHSAEALEILGPIFSNSTKYFFHIGPSYGNRCYNHVIQTHLMPYQLAEAAIRRLLEIGTDAFILHTNDYYASNISERIVNKMQNMQLTSKGTEVYTTLNNVMKDLNRALTDGGNVITILNDDEIQSEFYIAICEQTSFRYPKYKFINVILDSRNVEYIDNSCKYGIMTLNSYFEELADSDHNKLDIPYMAETMNRIVHTRIGMDLSINGEIESAYTAMQIWKTIIQKSNSIKVSEFKDYFHQYLDVPSGQIEIHTNNYVKRRIYCAQIDENGHYEINWASTALYIPKLYDPYNNDDFGCSCDLSDENKGEKYCSDPIVLTFLHETDLGGKTEKYNCLLQDVIIDEINSNGGVLGRELKANHSWITISNGFVNVRSIFELGKSNTFFGCITAECSKEVNRYLENRNSIFTFTGRDDGYTFNKNLIVTGLSINQRTQALLQYFSSIGLNLAYIVGPERNSTENEIFVISSGFKQVGINVVGYSMFSPFYDVSANEVISKIEKILETNDRIAIINLFIASENEKFVQFITKSSKFDNMILFFLKYDPIDITSDYRGLIKGSFVVSSYSSGVSGRESSKFQKLTTSYFQNALELNELYENSYTSIYLWKSAVEYSSDYSESKWPSIDYIQLSLKYISFNSPSGITKVLNNNHISKNVYIFRLSESSIMQVHPKQGKENILESIPIYLDPSECIYNKIIKTFELSETIRNVIISLSVIISLLCIIIAYIIFKYKKSKIIKSSSPIFLFYTLLSLALLACIGDVFIIKPDEEYICAFRVWFLSSAITFLLSILICKAWRIHKLFNNRELMRVKMSNWMILKMIGVFMIIELIYLTIWWSVDRSKPKLSYSDTYSTYLEDINLQECTENIAFVFIQIAIITITCLFGAKIAWSVRKASSEFNESMPLLSTISVILILGVILIPLNYLMDSEPDTLMGIRGIGIEVGVFFIVLILFGNKISYIYLFELRTTWMSSSLSHSGSTSREKSKLQKKQASKGRFRVTPHILDRLPIEIATISESDRFFLDSEIEGIVYNPVTKKHSTNNPLASSSN